MPCWRARPTEAVVSLAQIIILYTQKQGRYTAVTGSGDRERQAEWLRAAVGSHERLAEWPRAAARQPRALGRMPRLPG